MSDIVEEDDKKSYEDIEKIKAGNFDELSIKEDALLSDGDDDDDDKEEEEKEKEKIDEEDEEEKEQIDVEEEEQQDISDSIQM